MSMKLLADGKSRADVYTKLLPGYLAAKTGLSAQQCAEYCQSQMAQPIPYEPEGVELLTSLLTNFDCGLGPAFSPITGWPGYRRKTKISAQHLKRSHFMTLSEIRNMRQTCRAKVEDLLGRTSSREMSTEEKQLFTDLKAEGERLASLETRYAVLESFDKGVTATHHQPSAHRTNRRPTGPLHTSRPWMAFLRTGTMATDVPPLQIQQSPVSGAAAAVPTDVIPSIIQGIQ